MNAREPSDAPDDRRHRPDRRQTPRGRRDRDRPVLYSPAAVSVAAYGVLGLTSAASGAAWITGQVVELSPESQAVANSAGAGAVYVFAGTIATLIINSIVADRKAARESAERIALSEQRNDERLAAMKAQNAREVIEAKALADRLILAARADSDRRIAELEARLAATPNAPAAPPDRPSISDASGWARLQVENSRRLSARLAAEAKPDPFEIPITPES